MAHSKVTLNTIHKNTGARWSFAIVLISALLNLASVPTVYGQSQSIRIMPLGDSLTRGYPDYTGYRRSLYQSLTSLGYNVDFVGSQTDGSPTDFDRDHEGYNGEPADGVRDKVIGYLTTNPADIILLHIGTNDLDIQTQPPAEIAAEISEILDAIDTYEVNNSAEINVFLARIINARDPSTGIGPDITILNGLIQSMADSRIASGDKIVVVDQESVLAYPGDFTDTLHPTQGGYDKMADPWLSALTSYLPAIDNLNLAVASNDLVCSYDLTGSAGTAATAWNRDGSPIMSVYMPFEGGPQNALQDYSGNGYHGAGSGDILWQAENGFDGNGSLDLDGIDDSILVGDVMPTGAYTKSAWVYLEPGKARNNIISGSTEHVFWISDYGDSTGEIHLRAGHGTPWATVKDPEIFAPNSWTFVAVTYDPSAGGGTMVLYKNGSEVHRQIGVGAIPSDQSVFIGAFNGSSSYFQGSIDDARIYSRALQGGQVAALYSSGGNTIIASETSPGDTWQCRVTPFSSSLGGSEFGSNVQTIEAVPMPPTFTSTPVTSGTLGQGYSYDVDASGLPAPTYSLLVAPAGMTIDPDTGLIGWTPLTTGPQDVTVEATNSQGSDTQSFTINVGDCPDGMTAYYRMNEISPNYADDRGGADATCTNCPTAVAGIAEGGQAFDGIDDEVSVADNDQFDWASNSSFSIAFWMKKTSSCGGSGVDDNEVIVGRDSASSQLHWWVGVRCEGATGPEFSGPVNFTLRSRNGEKIVLTSGSTAVTDGTWHHVAAVRDNASGMNRLYVDGTLAASAFMSYTAGFDDASAEVTLGWLNLSGHFRYAGALDEVAVFNRSISEGEIEEHYNNGWIGGLGFCGETGLCTGVICGDGDVCNGDETCDPATGGCLPGTPLVCNDGDVCNGAETCDPTGGCQAGTPLVCNDDDVCNGAETCDPTGGCQAGTPLICDDGNVCNGAETCDPTGGCQPGTPLVCDDGDVCNGAETCDPTGGCQAGTPLVCDDGDVCNGAETCDPTGGCQAGTPLICDDGDVCNGAETCDPTGGCQPGTPLICDDGDVCNGDESCDPATGCQPGTPLVCDDGDFCTDDSCDTVTGCTNTPVICSQGDACDPVDGVCKPIDLCVGVSCDDGNLCTDDVCNPSTGTCTFINNTAPCDDGNSCTQNDICSNGTCSGTDGSCEEIITNFGSPYGVWASYNDSLWEKLHPTSPETMAAGNLDDDSRGDVVMDFGASGLWVRFNDSTWSKLHPSSSEMIVIGDLDGSGRDDVIVDFGSSGTWVWYNNTLWSKLHPTSPERMATGDMDGNGKDEVILDFGASGIWVRYNDTSWSKLHTASSGLIATADMDGSGQDEVIIDFGVSGIWIRYNDASWVKLHAQSPQSIAAGDMDGNGKDELVVDFGASGTWVRYNNATWEKLHSSSPDMVTAGDIDGSGRSDIVFDFGASGLWIWQNDAIWKKLHSLSADSILTGDLD